MRHSIKIILALFITFTSCSDDENLDIDKGFQAYVLGRYTDDDDIDHAALFKNGVLMDLSKSGISGPSKGTDVFVSNGDVYVSVMEVDTKEAHLLKNGKKLYSTDPSQNARFNGIYIDGDNVYACGYIIENNTGVAAVWKNGELTKLSKADGTINCSAGAVYADGNEVYVAGTYYELPNNSASKAIYWVNGQQFLINPTGYSNRGVDILAVNDDVYVLGQDRYWKNNEEIGLSDGADASHIFSYDGDLYITGDLKNDATLWKNDSISYLPTVNEKADTRFVTKDQDDVYVMGATIPFDGTSLDRQVSIWKNGEEVVTMTLENVAWFEAMYLVP
ncbi:hypothetical protein [Fulvivirga ligni]|uniref:hypothetical protein n=1 Tax=Fulvivirga ligni TaxID=2904246 RepID=UPI001F43F436|nr:hypothetical protein [Fulvivirga ligni]UII24275.1 hypothetical protein LVD16_13720 [Fulvivirga ligni]